MEKDGEDAEAEAETREEERLKERGNKEGG